MSRRGLLAGATAGAAVVLGGVAAGVPGTAHADARKNQARTQLVAAKISARTTELQRTLCALSASDLRSTGFYLPANTMLDVHVTTSTAQAPLVVIGAPDADPDKALRDPREYPLHPGHNTITDPGGGVIYYKVVGRNGYIRATLGDSAQRMPYFIEGSTREPEFQDQLDHRQTPYVELVTDRAMITIERASALRYRGEDHAALLATYKKIIEIEDVAVAGMTGDIPANDRLVHPYHFVGFPGAIAGVGAYATHGHMSFPVPIQDRLLTVEGLRLHGWGIYHELGHQHQQTPYKPADMTEVTVNIYSLAVNAAFAKSYGQGPRLFDPDKKTGLTPWESAVPKIGVSGNDYFADFDPYEKLVMFEQLRLSFPGFWPDLHRMVREDRPDPGDWRDPANTAYRHRMMVVLFSKNAGYDLTDFLTAWGFPVDAQARTQVDTLGLRKPPIDPTTARDTEQASLARRLRAGRES